MEKKPVPVVKPWIPRTLAVLAICFISLFALDALEGDAGLLSKAGALALHLIQSFVLLGLLIISWKKPGLGGFLFLITGVGFSIPVFALNYDRIGSLMMAMWIIFIITFPFVLTGILFILSGRIKRS
jgi:hypothetical protein